MDVRLRVTSTDGEAVADPVAVKRTTLRVKSAVAMRFRIPPSDSLGVSKNPPWRVQ
jgi:hypothetical protein